MDRMAYKGYESTPKHDAECGVFYGLVDGIDGLCEYESETAEGIEKAFRDAVDDYIDACRESFGLSAMIDATGAAEIRFLVDVETLCWLERESARTGISLEKVASAMLRKACNETPALGAPDIAGLERDLAAVDKKTEDDGPHGYPKPMDPKDVKARIVGEADEHGRTVLPAEEYCEEDDVYDELYPAPFASEAETCDFADAAARDVIDGRRVNQV